MHAEGPIRISSPNRLSRVGLTLIELVIVLVILVALTGIAVRSIQPLAEQARYERTQQTLININDALINRALTQDQVVSYSGFVADMGRLPVAIGSNPETQLAELWDQLALPTFTITNFDDPDIDNESAIPIAAGWRGPYLILPPGPNALKDGFGREFIVLNALNAPAASGENVANLVSTGANGVIDSMDVDYDRDLELPGGVWTPGRYQGSISVTVKEANGVDDPNLDSGETLRVRLYGPADGIPTVLQESAGTEATASGPVAFSDLISGEVIGPRVIVAYVTTGSGASLTVVRQSLPKQIVVIPGMNPTVQLNLPN